MRPWQVNKNKDRLIWFQWPKVWPQVRLIKRKEFPQESERHLLLKLSLMLIVILTHYLTTFSPSSAGILRSRDQVYLWASAHS